jgi:hypothetical protein
MQTLSAGFRKALVAVALVAWPALGQQPGGAASAANRVTLEAPKTGAVVSGSEVTVSGRYTADVKDDIWVIVWPEKAPGKGWPQTLDAARGVPAAKEPGGQWLVGCTLGGPPQSYEIRVYTATRQASARLAKLLEQWARKKDYPGLLTPDLPPGLTERARITIRRDR